jgi:hypothetical protein
MEFVSYILKNENAAIYWNMSGLIIFIAFFIVVLIRTYRMPKEVAEKYKNSVLEN